MDKTQVPADDLVTKDVFELLGIDGASDEQKDEIRARMLETIRDRVLLRIADAMSQEDFEQYKQLLEAPEGEKADTAIDAFLADRSIDLNALTVEETILVKAEAVKAAHV